MTTELVSRSEARSAALAQGLARLLEAGDVVFLTGPLGAGKTFFIRHAAAALGVTEPVTSPSYTMGQTYSGAVRIHHLDLYRLAEFTAEDAVDFEPFFEQDAITFIEWPERAEPYISRPDVVVRLDHVDINSRRISFEANREDLRQELEKLVAGARD